MSTDLQHDSPTALAVDTVGNQPNLEVIESSTRSFLEIIHKWQEQTLKLSLDLPESARETRVQVANYVIAYSDALKSAQDGYTAAEEGLALSEHAKQADVSQADLSAYIVGMRDISSRGQERSRSALNGFRSVRKGIYEALTRIGQGSNLDTTSESSGSTAILKQSLSVLEDFENLMNWYIFWWTERNMEESSQASKIQGLAKNRAKLGVDGVVLKWQILKDSYSDYTDKMQRLQDDYPEVFELASEKRTLSVEFPSESTGNKYEQRPRTSEQASVEEKQEIISSTNDKSPSENFTLHIDPLPVARPVDLDDKVVAKSWWKCCLCQ